MTVAEMFAEPQEVDEVMMAYPASVIGTLMPKREELPEEFRKNWRYNEYCGMAEEWFLNGIDAISFRPGIDANKAGRHLQACLGSFEPSYEHKIGAVGWLMSLWGARITSRKEADEEDDG